MTTRPFYNEAESVSEPDERGSSMPHVLPEFFSRLVSSFPAASGFFPKFDLHSTADRTRFRIRSGSFSSGSSFPVYETSDFSRHFQDCLPALSGISEKSCQKGGCWFARFVLHSGLRSLKSRKWKRIFGSRRVLSLLVGGAVAMSSLVLEGCALPADAASRYFIFATPLASHPIWLQAKAGFEDACKELGVEGDWLGPNIIDVEAMEKVVETGILQKADGMITQGVLSSELVQAAKRKGLPVVLVDSDMKPEDRLCFLGKDFHEQARLFLNDIEARLGKNEPLTIAIQAANLAFDIAQEQIQEIRYVFAAHPGGFPKQTKLTPFLTGSIEHGFCRNRVQTPPDAFQSAAGLKTV